MQPERRPPDASAPLDRERGRTDARAQLQLHLAEAPIDYLEGALDNPDLGPDELKILLRNRAGTAELVTRVGRNRAWMGTRAIQVALVANPRAPQVLARRYLPHLTWRDLADVSGNLRLSPVLRREAEKLLKTRIPELSVGERVALARQGSRGVVLFLRDETDALVLRALAGNARATEGDIVGVLARRDIPPGFLGWLAGQSSWSQRRTVRLALVRHPQTPSPAALRLMRALSRQDLEDLCRDPAVPRLVRVAAERHLAGGGTKPAGARPRFG